MKLPDVLAAAERRFAGPLPAWTRKTGTAGNQPDCMAGSSAPSFTLAAKPIAAYHFIALSAERLRTWRLCHVAESGQNRDFAPAPLVYPSAYAYLSPDRNLKRCPT